MYKTITKTMAAGLQWGSDLFCGKQLPDAAEYDVMRGVRGNSKSVGGTVKQ